MCIYYSAHIQSGPDRRAKTEDDFCNFGKIGMMQSKTAKDTILPDEIFFKQGKRWRVRLRAKS